jgi:pyruvate dehydrogenase E2 component (dihydrolipoamide acetyltransferase)
MGASVHETARVTLVTEADGTKLVAVRNRLKADKAESLGFTPGYNDLIGLIVARTLNVFPYMNARLSEDGQKIELLEDVNLGVAVDSDRGLVVPVIKRADQISLQVFGSQFRTLVDRAVSGRPSPGDLQGGTFTITNLGGFEVDAFTPVINLPEVAILGIGRIHEKAVPIEGNIEVRKMVTLSLVFDHRLVDGAPAARFLQQIKQTIEAANSVDWGLS